MTLDEVEREQEKRGREVQRRLLQAHMDERGPGDVGPAIEVLEGRKKLPRRHGEHRWHERKVLTIFGALVLNRLAYHADEAASIHPLDEADGAPGAKVQLSAPEADRPRHGPGTIPRGHRTHR
jgi:hypothetical protein